ncbi:MAG TPA: amidohydrolase [Nitrolancea sp.]|nr:amidohydrolase [Nitrolancea sp.]
MIDQIQITAELDAWLRETRRYLHMNPELSLDETNTSRLVSGHLNELGIPHRTRVGGDGRPFMADPTVLEAAGLKLKPTTGGTGLLGTIQGRGPGKTLLIRADMDALPIDEQNQTPYRSTKPGVMHACGHDAHTTILMGVAEVLNGLQDQFDGTVKLMFQPGEEGSAGALAMIHDGILDDPPVDAALALHVDNELPAGQIGVSSGVLMASGDVVKILVRGVGGHAAYPHLAVDTILVGAHILVALQDIIAREVDPFKSAVVTFGALHSGTKSNIIPDSALLEGTVRTFLPEVRDLIEQRIPAIASGVAKAFRAEATVNYLRWYPSMNNDTELSEVIRSAASERLGAENVKGVTPTFGGEDFAFVSQKVPSCMFRLGVANPGRGITYSMHHPRFDLDEDALAVGVEVMAAAALRYLNG